MTGSLQIKGGKYYAVISYKNETGKRKQKWIGANLTVKGNKRRAEDFLQKVLAQSIGMAETVPNILFCFIL